jgi:predicted TIM-barrel fold metal-dependent hydrolase
MKRIDAHIHYAGDHESDRNLLDRHGLKLLNISVATPNKEGWRARTAKWEKLASEDSPHYAWCAGFDLPTFDNTDYIDQCITGLERDFDAGAVACKIWKNIGMEIKKADGTFIMVDDVLFDPIYDFLEKRDIALLLHIGEPLACWQPLDNPQNPHYGYYKGNPQWHMYDKSEFPSHSTIIDARDRLVAKRPNLRIIGAHLASLEWDVDEVAKRLRQYANFAVDTSARMLDLTCQDSAKVRSFFAAFPEQILYGSDMVYNDFSSSLSEEQRQDRIALADARWQMEFDYYESSAIVDVRGRSVQGLGLSGDVLENFYHKNAERWYPGL